MTEKIGQELLRSRQGQNIALEQAAEETHIRLHYLEAMEKGDFSQLPSKAHMRGFLRTYADYLGIAPDSLLNILDEPEYRSPETEPVAQEVQTPDVPETTPNSILIFKDMGSGEAKRDAWFLFGRS